MRKVAFIIANTLMKILNKNHNFRFIVFYFAQIIISQSLQFLLMVSIGYILNILPYVLLTMLSFFTIRQFFIPYHAFGFTSCTIISTSFTIGISLIGASTNYIFIPMITYCWIWYMDTVVGKQSLDYISRTIEHLYKKFKKGCKNDR